MAIEIEQLIKYLSILGFTKSDTNDFYHKVYDSLDYTISIDIKKEKIDYGSKIKLGDHTTSNFEKSENFVVLECVNRLLEKKYRPEDLELEKRYKLGGQNKSGKTDIFVRGKNKKALIIIECKTFGYEFNKEMERMRENGGQLFSYYQQDKSAKFLCLYTSQFVDDKIENKYKLVYTEDKKEEIENQNSTEQIITFSKATHVKELVEVWKYKVQNNIINEFEDEGIFEEYYLEYQPGVGPLKKSSLKELVFYRNEPNNIYRQFEESLRHHNISDRSNAFNRVISLILAKIVDEEKSEDEVLDFQIKPVADTPEELYDRLAELYKRAMDKYLKEKYTFYSAEEIEKIIISFPKQTAKDEIRRILKETKYYSNNEFAFKEIYNKELFEQNFLVLKEIIQLFQPFRFKYNRKSQFLGDFFENLLEEGFKQTEGQFFTPTPLAKFIVSSLPLKEYILNKIQNEDSDFLPRIIDYACGSGHFLTESIEEIQQIVDELHFSEDTNIDMILSEYKKSTKWAKDYIFGIEKDYRLARTSQVACFMHGDGDANIIFGDGLELWNGKNGQKYYFEDESFDFLVANPPYSIKDFTKHLNDNKLAKFELLNIIRNSESNPDDIEVLFLERIKQLLKVGGIAGVFFPSSILSNTGLYTKAREILIKNFEIKAIFEPSSNAFAKTGTNTIVLFIKRRNPNFALDCRYIAEDLIMNNKTRKNDFLDSTTLLNNYINYLKIDIDDYKSIISRNANENIKTTEFFENYSKAFFNSSIHKEELKKSSFKKLSDEGKKERLNSLLYDFILEIETEKFVYFLLTHRRINENNSTKFIPQQLVIIKAGSDNDSQRAFLGYKWSDSKSGAGKGIQYNLDENNLHNTKLYEVKRIEKEFYGKKENIEKTEKNNPEKANYYVFNALMDNFDFQISSDFENNINLSFLVDCFDFDRVAFDKQISLNPNINYQFTSKFDIVPLSNILKLISGLTYDNSVVSDKVTEYQVLTASNIDLNTSKIIFDSIINLKYEPIDSETILRKNDIFICTSSGSISHLGKIAYFDNENTYYAGGFCGILRSSSELTQKYLFNLLNYSKEYQIFLSKFKGSNINNLKLGELGLFKIPLPPLDIQQQIVDEIEVLEEKETKGKEKIEEKKGEISIMFDNYYSKGTPTYLDNLCSISSGGTPRTTIKEYWSNGSIPWLKSEACKNDYIRECNTYITEIGLKSSNTKMFSSKSTLIALVGATKGKTGFLMFDSTTNQNIAALYPKDLNVLHPLYLFYSCKKLYDEISKAGEYKMISVGFLKGMKINLNTIDIQNEVITKILEIENEIEEIEKSISGIAEEKKLILKRYLE